ncbi:hypothetical protein N0V95_002636 [Ascochyta clinopodiicola]|nr:hypothetical protein N0V95_002636 [Ascochyta clinopodiicola]
MGKRLSESIGTGVDIDDYQEVDAGRKRASFLRKRKGTNEYEMFQHELKSRISNPFDFQHLTHADRHQVAALEQASGSVLIAGWAERAARLSGSGIWDAFTVSATAPTDQLPGIEEDTTYVGNAVTTPDDSAVQATTPPFSPRLEDVAEEPERFVSPRPAPQPPRLRSPTSPKSPFLESFSFNQRSPGATKFNSQRSETLGSPESPRKSPVPKPSVVRRKSNTWRAIEDSWEDDVDYIYEHALEADCDNDWDCVSEDESFADRHHALAWAIREDRPAAPRASQPLHPQINENPMFQFQLPFDSSRLSPSNDSVPDLGPTSAVSASTTVTSLQTPFHESEGFMLSPSLLLPQVYKDAEEASYEDILKEYVGSDCHFPIIDQNGSANSSARSSRVRFSRRSSYDSSLMSSAQSSGLWSSPIRRSASSAGSLPELVHSRRTRQNFSLIVDELSEQVASLESFGSDDGEGDDVTPPGPLRLSTDRTFFTPTQERSDNQGYQHSKRYHKQALSDGAAQLLTSTEPPKLRGRAATTSRSDGEEYLHLFPTPPSFSPPITN